MRISSKNIGYSILTNHVLVLDTSDCFTCSFTEFLPFTSELYYFSSYKDFRS
ncbi:MAG: hypothetical protein ABIQ31_02325 [Ferruginibacter sp.]